MRAIASKKSVLLLLAVTLAAIGEARAERLPIKAYTTADGLAHNRITRIVRDSRGFLWFCTADGLSRFDGARFTNYNVEDGLPSTSINLLLETRGGDYWVATNGGGVARLNSSAGPRPMAPTESHARFRAYPISNEAATNRVNILLEDGTGVLWAGTDGGLFRMDGEKGEPEFHAIELQIPSRPDLSVQVWDLVEGND
ncbi:MAG TPA: two-component regulator propeller domain-containing protein, partial [Blastocatellia bacterium]